MTNDTFRPPHGMGRRRDQPDRRDRLLYAASPNVDALPDEIDNSKLLPEVFDQGTISSCVGWSCATVAYTVMRLDGHRRPFMASPVFLYREARLLGGYVEEDAGTELRLAWKAANQLGLPPMSVLKPRYRPSDMPDASTGVFPENSIWRKPATPSTYADAERRQMTSYFRLLTLGDLLKCLAEGFCAQVGMDIYRSLYGPQGPVVDVPDPEPGEQLLGGHAATAYGYSKPRRRLLLRNQWGATAHEGTPNFTISFDYVQRYASDAWCGKLIEGGKVSRGLETNRVDYQHDPKDP